MKLGVVTTSYPRTRHDPAGEFVAGFSRWLARQGHEVDVIAAGDGAAPDGAIAVDRVSDGAELFYDEGAPDRLAHSWRARARAPRFAAALVARVAAHARRWDAVVSHWLAPSGLAAALTRRPHLAIAHSGDVHLLARAGVADATVAALLAGGPVRVAFAGEHLRARMLGACRVLARPLEARSFSCAMGIDVGGFAALRPAVPAAVRGVPLVAFIGRLVPIKGAHVLIDACARLGRPVQLVIAGAGPERAALEAQAARHAGLKVRFSGEVRGSARDALYAAADAVVLPSIDLADGRTEGTPTVALEALAAGVPLVASDVGGVRAAVGAAAWLCRGGDVDALAAALRARLDDHDGAVARVRAGRALAVDFDWSSVGARLWMQMPVDASRYGSVSSGASVSVGVAS